MITIILGGARSGKSTTAEMLAAQLGGDEVVYIATATALDDEMTKRIERHRLDRPQSWLSVEAPLDLSSAIKAHQDAKVILVDCLTLWLNNQLHQNPKENFTALFDELIAAAKKPQQIIFVANEVGLGIIPMGEVTRRFVDEAGRLNRQLASAADRVLFVIAGIAQTLKGEPL